MSTTVRVTAYFASLLVAGSIGYYAHKPDTIIHTVPERIDYTNKAKLEELWQNMPQGFRNEKVKENIRNLSKEDIYDIGAKYAIDFLQNKKTRKNYNSNKTDNISEFQKGNAQQMYDILKKYSEETK